MLLVIPVTSTHVMFHTNNKHTNKQMITKATLKNYMLIGHVLNFQKVHIGTCSTTQHFCPAFCPETKANDEVTDFCTEYLKAFFVLTFPLGMVTRSRALEALGD